MNAEIEPGTLLSATKEGKRLRSSATNLGGASDGETGGLY